MAASEILKARVDPKTARRVRRWATEHGTDVSGALRAAIERLLEERDREKRVARAMREFEKAKRMGLFDPPKGPWKAGGFR